MIFFKVFVYFLKTFFKGLYDTWYDISSTEVLDLFFPIIGNNFHFCIILYQSFGRGKIKIDLDYLIICSVVGLSAV